MYACSIAVRELYASGRQSMRSGEFQLAGENQVRAASLAGLLRWNGVRGGNSSYSLTERGRLLAEGRWEIVACSGWTEAESGGRGRPMGRPVHRLRPSWINPLPRPGEARMTGGILVGVQHGARACDETPA